MHVQFFPVYVLTCGAHHSTPLLSFDLADVSHETFALCLTDVILIMKSELPASHGNRISKAFVRSNISCVHFRDLVCWVLWVVFPCSLTLIHSMVSTSDISTGLSMLHNILKSFEPVLPSLWHSGFTWLQPGL